MQQNGASLTRTHRDDRDAWRRETKSVFGRTGLVAGFAACHPVTLGVRIVGQPRKVRRLLFKSGDLRVDDLHLALRRRPITEEFARDPRNLLERHAERLREPDHQRGGDIPLAEDLVGVATAPDTGLWCQKAFADIEKNRVLAETGASRELSNQHPNHHGP